MDPQVLAMLSGMQGAQAAGPSAQQPMGAQMPQQMPLARDFAIFISMGKQIAQKLGSYGKEAEANELDLALNKITKLKIALDEEFAEAQQQQQLVQMAMQ